MRILHTMGNNHIGNDKKTLLVLSRMKILSYLIFQPDLKMIRSLHLKSGGGVWSQW